MPELSGAGIGPPPEPFMLLSPCSHRGVDQRNRGTARNVMGLPLLGLNTPLRSFFTLRYPLHQDDTRPSQGRFTPRSTRRLTCRPRPLRPAYIASPATEAKASA